MSEALLIAILNFAAKVGLDAAIAFLQNRGAGIDDAIAALGKAKEKSLADYIEDDKRRLALIASPAPAPPAPPA